MSEPFPGDAARAAPYRGRLLRVITIDLNKPLPPEAHGVTPVSGFALHPALGVKVIDEKGLPVAPGTLVIVCERKGVDATP